MDAAAVFAILEKGLAVLPILIAAGQNVADFIERMRAVAKAQADGVPVSDDQLNALEADLDAAVAEFNKPME